MSDNKVHGYDENMNEVETVKSLEEQAEITDLASGYSLSYSGLKTDRKSFIKRGNVVTFSALINNTKRNRC